MVSQKTCPNAAICRQPIAGRAGVIRFVMTTILPVKGFLNEVKGKLKQKYGQLTDFLIRRRQDHELLGRLQQKLGKSKEDLRAEIEKL